MSFFTFKQIAEINSRDFFYKLKLTQGPYEGCTLGFEIIFDEEYAFDRIEFQHLAKCANGVSIEVEKLFSAYAADKRSGLNLFEKKLHEAVDDLSQVVHERNMSDEEDELAEKEANDRYQQRTSGRF